MALSCSYITKAQNVLPAYPGVNLNIKVDIDPEDTIKVGGGGDCFCKINERFEKVLKIMPLENIVQLRIDVGGAFMKHFILKGNFKKSV